MLCVLLILAPLFVKNFIIFQLTIADLTPLAVLALNILDRGSGQFRWARARFMRSAPIPRRS